MRIYRQIEINYIVWYNFTELRKLQTQCNFQQLVI